MEFGFKERIWMFLFGMWFYFDGMGDPLKMSERIALYLGGQQHGWYRYRIKKSLVCRIANCCTQFGKTSKSNINTPKN